MRLLLLLSLFAAPALADKIPLIRMTPSGNYVVNPVEVPQDERATPWVCMGQVKSPQIVCFYLKDDGSAVPVGLTLTDKDT